MKHKWLSEEERQKLVVGFTLVEVILAVAIIGILAAITIIGIGSWRTRVAETEIKSDASSLRAGMEAIRNQTDEYPVFAVGTEFDGTNSTRSVFIQSDNVNITYAGGNTTYYCVDIESTDEATVYLHLDTSGGNTEPQAGTC
jgi:prepilin-type N-terminal cleavage/methylation domain-containing protein